MQINLFGRVETPKGIETIAHYRKNATRYQFGRVETPKGIETQNTVPAAISVPFGRVETPKGIETPPCVFTVSGTLFGRVETPKGIETNCAGVILLNIL